MIFWFVIFGYLLEELSQLESMNVFLFKTFWRFMQGHLIKRFFFFFFFPLFELWKLLEQSLVYQ